MAKIDYENKMNSKPYHFFDMIYRMIVLNVLTILLFCTVLFAYPALITCYEVLKEGSTGSNLFKQYFYAFKRNLKKSLKIGLLLFLLEGAAAYGMYFYYNSISDVSFTSLFINVGFSVDFIAFIIILFLSCHIPLLLLHFNDWTTMDIFKTSIYVTFRFFLTSLILLFLNLIPIILFIYCMFVPGFLAIWMLLGISLPIYLIIQITKPIYYKISKINFALVEQLDREEMENKNE